MLYDLLLFSRTHFTHLSAAWEWKSSSLLRPYKVDTCLMQKCFFMVMKHQYWCRLLQVGQPTWEHFALRWRLFLLFFIVSWTCCSCCHVEEGGTVLEHLKWEFFFFFPCPGSFSEWLPKLERVKRQQCKLCSVEGKEKVKSPSYVWLFATQWTVACQSPPSMGFSRQEYWSVLPFPSPGDLPNESTGFWRLADLVKMYFVWQLLSATPDIYVNIVSCMSASVWISSYPYNI